MDEIVTRFDTDINIVDTIDNNILESIELDKIYNEWEKIEIEYTKYLDVNNNLNHNRHKNDIILFSFILLVCFLILQKKYETSNKRKLEKHEKFLLFFYVVLFFMHGFTLLMNERPLETHKKVKKN